MTSLLSFFGSTSLLSFFGSRPRPITRSLRRNSLHISRSVFWTGESLHIISRSEKWKRKTWLSISDSLILTVINFFLQKIIAQSRNSNIPLLKDLGFRLSISKEQWRYWNQFYTVRIRFFEKMPRWPQHLLFGLQTICWSGLWLDEDLSRSYSSICIGVHTYM